MTPELTEAIRKLSDQPGIKEIIQEGESYLIITDQFYATNEPIIIYLTQSKELEDTLVASDNGKTIGVLTTLIEPSSIGELVQDNIGSWGALNITQQGEQLVVCNVKVENLLPLISNYSHTCLLLCALAKFRASYQKANEEDARIQREAREAKAFRLSSRDEIVAFQNRLNTFLRRERIFSNEDISLIDAYDVIKDRTDCSKVFTAILDLVISYYMLQLDTRDSLNIWKGYFGEGGLEAGSILDSDMAFSLRMYIHRYNSSFVMRYRAIWDKLMGLFVLLFQPSAYEQFQSAKSKKSAFTKIANKAGVESPLSFYAQSIIELLTRFDNNYRTAEAHQTGTIREWTLIVEPYEESPQHELNEFWANLNTVLSHLGNAFRGIERVQQVAVKKTESWVEAQSIPGILHPPVQKALSTISTTIPQLAKNHPKELVVLVLYGTEYVKSAIDWRFSRNPEFSKNLMDSSIKKIESTVATLPDEIKPIGHSILDSLHEIYTIFSAYAGGK